MIYLEERRCSSIESQQSHVLTVALAESLSNVPPRSRWFGAEFALDGVEVHPDRSEKTLQVHSGTGLLGTLG